MTESQSSAVSASMNSPVKSISAARLREMLRDSGTAGVEQKRPRLIPRGREARVVGGDREELRDQLAAGGGGDSVHGGDHRLGQGD